VRSIATVGEFDVVDADPGIDDGPVVQFDIVEQDGIARVAPGPDRRDEGLFLPEHLAVGHELPPALPQEDPVHDQ
jgi:hypothetical protein